MSFCERATVVYLHIIKTHTFIYYFFYIVRNDMRKHLSSLVATYQHQLNHQQQ